MAIYARAEQKLKTKYPTEEDEEEIDVPKRAEEKSTMEKYEITLQKCILYFNTLTSQLIFHIKVLHFLI